MLYYPLLLLDPSYREEIDLQRNQWTNGLSSKHFKRIVAQAEADIPKIDPAQMIGRDMEKGQVLDSVLYWIAKDEKVRGRFNLSPPKRNIILRGSSGTGKSFFVKAIARTSFELFKQRSIPLFFLELTSSSLFSSWYGQSAKNLDSVLAKASVRPTIIFIDEIDALAAKLGEVSQAVDKEDIRVVKSLLRRLDEIESEPETPVVVIAASNQYEKIPVDVRRRFGRPLDFDVGITAEMIMAVIQDKLKKYRWNLKPESVKSAIEDGIRAVGHAVVTPDDVIRVFEQVYAEPGSQTQRSAVAREPALDAFKTVARTIRSFAEEEKVEVVKNFAARVRPQETLSDVGGLIGKKEEILKEINLGLVPSLSKKMGIEPPRGFLLYGPPGTGKTLLAKAIAHETNASLYLVNSPELLRKFTGQSEQAVKDLFTEAKKNQPSIIFFDEIDAVAVSRGLGGMPSVVNQLLSEMDGMRGLEGVVVIATTNRLDILDSALLRPGRFTRHIDVPVPKTDEERLDILDVHLHRIGPLLVKDVTAERTLELCKGRLQTPAELAQVVKDAATLRAKDLVATQKILETIGDPVQMAAVKGLYKRDLQRLNRILGTEADGEDTFLEHIRKLREEDYRVTLTHVQLAVEDLSQRELFRTIQRAQDIHRPRNPEVGKVNTILTVEKDSPFTVLGVIECSVFKQGQGLIEVTGPMKERVQDSARQARALLRNYLPEIQGCDFHVQLVLPAEETLSKFRASLGLAVGVAMISAYSRLAVKSSTIVVGAMDILPPGRIGFLEGMEGRNLGRILESLEEGLISEIYLPKSACEDMEASDFDFLARRGIKIVASEKFGKVVENVLVDSPEKDSLVSKFERTG
ncbi:MAG: AAA family ATPase [Candidatus Bathyarchaeia archaeon]